MRNRIISSLLTDPFLIIVASLILMVSVALFRVSAAYSEVPARNVGRVLSYQGNVTVTRAYNQETLKVDKQIPVMFRDVSETDFDSLVELQFIDGSTLVIGEDTVLTIDEMFFDPNTGRRSARLNLKSGTIRLKATKNRNPNSKFEVTTPLVVAGLRGTELTVSVDKNGNARVITLEGAVAVWKRGAPKGARKEVLIVAGMTTGMSPGDSEPSDAISATAKQIRAATSATRMTKPALKKHSGEIRSASSDSKGKEEGRSDKGVKVSGAFKKNRKEGIRSNSTLKSISKEISEGPVRALRAVFHVAGITSDVARNVARGITKKIARNEAKNAARCEARSVATSVAKSAAKNAAKEAARAAVNESAKNAVVESARSVAKETAKEVAKNSAKEVGKNNGSNKGNGNDKEKK